MCPTALHSWGNALRGCPCKCRKGPFSWDRLRQQGLRGVGVFSDLDLAPRFLHPREAGYLNTLPPSFTHLPDMRAALCLIGQIAAPAQSLWLCALLRGWAAEIAGIPCPSPLSLLQEYKRELQNQRDDLWLLRYMHEPHQALVRDLHGPRSVRLSGPTTVGDFIAAEKVFQEPGFKMRILHGLRHLPMHCCMVTWSKSSTAWRSSAKPRLMLPSPPCDGMLLLLLTPCLHWSRPVEALRLQRPACLRSP